MDDTQRYPSPDDTHYILTTAYEARMSHFIFAATLWHSSKDKCLLTIGDTQWDASNIIWEPDSSAVALILRRYPGDCAPIRVVMHINLSLAEIHTSKGISAVDFQSLANAMEQYYAMCK